MTGSYFCRKKRDDYLDTVYSDPKSPEILPHLTFLDFPVLSEENRDGTSAAHRPEMLAITS